ncbi:MAG: TfoX/Sxy family protein [Bacteroidales bacterium]|nr:TfoX/Sxy family protein [Bacteroidales bacterium]
MGSLRELPNIGAELERRLIAVDIKTAEELKKVGAVNAFMRIKAIYSDACICKFMALEGAVQGIRWHNLSIAKKEELKTLFKTL